ncbi:MAG: DUF1553 domain-containing protein [Planctomycetaceae bacterium]
MKAWWTFLTVLAVCSWVSEAAGQGVQRSADEPNAPRLFEETILPVFKSKCLSCHGPDVQKSGYRLDVRKIAFAGGDSGEPSIVPGDSAASPILRYVSDEEADVVMPPADSGVARLTASETAALRAWIDQGAAWPDSSSETVEEASTWWSFEPLRMPPKPNGAAHTIDSFVQRKLAEVGLSSSPPADARTIARRLHFDLIGLPPSPVVLDRFGLAFRIDPDAAVDDLVEELLASPHYGERWARHWLDVVHYGDTHGYDKDKPRPHAWPYRDYVIRSFNEDKPYARFVEEQIAGDVLWPATADGIEAMGFIAAGPWDFIGHAEVPETKIDGKLARHLDRDDMVSNTIGTFCSVTVHCAQCHQHKFDPISQEDYYSLQAVFAALDRTDRPYYRNETLHRRFKSLEGLRSELTSSLQQIEQSLIRQAGEDYIALTDRIERASQAPQEAANKSPRFGYHSAIASHQDESKWVQVDLGQPLEIRRVVLLPCYDDFNAIGAGFGFPRQFKIEVADDPGFGPDRKQLWPTDETVDDFDNPGLQPLSIQTEEDARIVGRYIRVTATKLASRKEDFIFALAELQAFDSAGKNIALERPVTALDSIESKPRWSMANLTDGIAPSLATVDHQQQLVRERDALLDKASDETTRLRRRQLSAKLDEVTAELSRLPSPDRVYAAGIHHGSGSFLGTGADGGRPRPIFWLARGQVTRPVREVAPGALSALSFQPARFSLAPDADEGQRRVALAHWITDPSNPLTWRSIVNRVWQYHFGRGLVETANDFGRNGALPSHPELLDWLAIEFRDGGGSVKNLHRWIVKSATYRQSSVHNAAGAEVDGSNALLWRQNRRRLEAEAIRDAVLAVSGKLDTSMGGPGWQDFVVTRPEHSPHYEYELANADDPQTWRRSIYRFIVRSQPHPWMTSLDCADPSMRVDKRSESLSAVQALAMLNNGFMLTQSKHFADRVERECQDLRSQVNLAYRLALGDEPSDGDRERLVKFTAAHGLPYLCRVLLNLNAFTFVD